MKKNTSISLGTHFEHFIQQILSEGRYQNASEVIRAGLRLLEDQEQRKQALKMAIENGVKSGIAEGFDPIKHLEMLNKGKK